MTDDMVAVVRIAFGAIIGMAYYRYVLLPFLRKIVNEELDKRSAPSTPAPNLLALDEMWRQRITALAAHETED